MGAAPCPVVGRRRNCAARVVDSEPASTLWWGQPGRQQFFGEFRRVIRYGGTPSDSAPQDEPGIDGDRAVAAIIRSQGSRCTIHSRKRLRLSEEASRTKRNGNCS